MRVQPKKSKGFPKTIYVTVEDAGDGETYLSATGLRGGAENGQHVAIYELAEIKKAKITHELV